MSVFLTLYIQDTAIRQQTYGTVLAWILDPQAQRHSNPMVSLPMEYQ